MSHINQQKNVFIMFPFHFFFSLVLFYQLIFMTSELLPFNCSLNQKSINFIMQNAARISQLQDLVVGSWVKSHGHCLCHSEEWKMSRYSTTMAMVDCWDFNPRAYTWQLWSVREIVQMSTLMGMCCYRESLLSFSLTSMWYEKHSLFVIVKASGAFFMWFFFETLKILLN